MPSNRVTRTLISDPGHGWLAVPRSEILELDIAEKISEYSYVNGWTVYLEEDCDMDVYLRAMEDRGIEVNFLEAYEEETMIRDYARWTPDFYTSL